LGCNQLRHVHERLDGLVTKKKWIDFSKSQPPLNQVVEIVDVDRCRHEMQFTRDGWIDTKFGNRYNFNFVKYWR
tara:strand:- start:8688 stop:8909 length:222 start_codon:yes stop_codon:yes gene_type:complete